MNNINLSDKIERWAKKFEEHMKIRELTKEETKLFLSASFNEKQINEDKEILKLLETKKAGLASVMYLRVKSIHTYELTPALAVYLFESGIINNFGKSTMIINYLQYIAHERGLKNIGMKEFGMFVFPMGVPTEESWDKAWEANKLQNIFIKEEVMELQRDITAPDNILDYPRAMESIREIKEQ